MTDPSELLIDARTLDRPGERRRLLVKAVVEAVHDDAVLDEVRPAGIGLPQGERSIPLVAELAVAKREVHVPLVQQIGRFPVIGAKHNPVGPFRSYDR